MKLHEYFSGLLDRAVNLNPGRLEQLARHEKALTEWLRGDSTFGPTVEAFIRQGSWAHRTIIRPLPGQEFDADLLVQMKPQRAWSKDPRRYPEALYEAMVRSPRHRDKVELKTRCVRVNYANDCHVDLVPYLYLPFYGIFDRHVIVNRTANELEDVNPAGFAEWFRAKDRVANGHLRTSLRLLKYMRDYKGTFDVPSVILTVLVGDRVSQLLSWWDDRYRDLPTTFRSLVLATARWPARSRSGTTIRWPTAGSSTRSTWSGSTRPAGTGTARRRCRRGVDRWLPVGSVGPGSARG